MSAPLLLYNDMLETTSRFSPPFHYFFIYLLHPQQPIYSVFKFSNCLIVSSNAKASVSKSLIFLSSTSCNSLATFCLHSASFKIFSCFWIPCFVFSSFLEAFEISASMSTRPLTCRKTAADEETEKTTQPEGRASVDERMVIDETPLPERERMDCSCAVTVS